MGDRYIIEITCPDCGFKDGDCFYAPTCGFTEWECPKCGHVVDLAEYTGISYEDASNREEIERLSKMLSSNHERLCKILSLKNLRV